MIHVMIDYTFSCTPTDTHMCSFLAVSCTPWTNSESCILVVSDKASGVEPAIKSEASGRNIICIVKVALQLHTLSMASKLLYLGTMRSRPSNQLTASKLVTIDSCSGTKLSNGCQRGRHCKKTGVVEGGDRRFPSA